MGDLSSRGFLSDRGQPRQTPARGFPQQERHQGLDTRGGIDRVVGAVGEKCRLARTYPLALSLSMKGYLKRTYPGRQILTRIRIDDLPLGAAGSRAAADTGAICKLCRGCPPANGTSVPGQKIVRGRSQSQNQGGDVQTIGIIQSPAFLIFPRISFGYCLFILSTRKCMTFICETCI